MLNEKINTDIKKAMKAHEEQKLSVLRMLSTELKNVAIKKGTKDEPLSDDEIVEVLMRQVKQRRESAIQYKEGGREDLATVEEQEMEILKEYLPESISEEDLEVIVKDAITQTGAETIQEMGKVMGIVMTKVKGKATGDQVSAMVKKLLS